jgi:hypothetical protein
LARAAPPPAKPLPALRAWTFLCHCFAGFVKIHSASLRPIFIPANPPGPVGRRRASWPRLFRR